MAQDARRSLLGALIDYAGLFPPAALGVDEAVAGYRSARRGEHSWVLDRFVCPASALDELRAAVGGEDERWRVTVVVDRADLGDGAALQAELVSAGTAGDGLVLDALEVRMPPDGASRESAANLATLNRIALESGFPGSVQVFVEVPLDGALDHALGLVAEHDLAAKVRCGGPTPEHVPSVHALAGFIAGCASRSLRWKATAGLHHPFRQTDGPTGAAQHGFLNLLAASGLGAAEPDVELIAAALDDDDPDSFALGAEGLRWREHLVGPEARARFDGYGSCSFDEPVADLVAIGALERERHARA